MKLKSVINEEIKTYLTEIGEINLQSYPHHIFMDYPYLYESRFTTEDGDEYSVHFNNAHIDLNKWIGGFKLIKGAYTDVVNKGRLYRVMATVIEIMSEFINKRKPKMILVDAVKSAGDNDNRRTNLYVKYFQNAFSNDYDIIQTDEFIKLKRKENISENILNELEHEVNSLLNESYLTEVGDANLQKYDWRLMSKHSDKWVFDFVAHDDEFFDLDKFWYVVIFEKIKFRDNSWSITFKQNIGNFYDIVNGGNFYRIMATLVNIINKFVDINHPDLLFITPSKNIKKNQKGETLDDSRRFNIYMQYIKKNIIDDYTVISDNDEIGIYRKDFDPNNFNDNQSLNESVYKVYHGTNDQFDKFDFNKTAQGIVWFTDSIDSIKNQEHGGQGNKHIMTRYITINNPAGWNEYEKYGLQQLEDMGYDGVILPQGDKIDYFVFSNKNIKKIEETEDIADVDNGEPEISYDSTNDDSYFSPMPNVGDHLRSISEDDQKLNDNF